MASALLGPLCQRINPVYHEYRLMNNVTEEIDKLRFTVSLIEGVLQDAEDKQVNNPPVGTWLISLRQVLYDAEDVLDEVATDAALLRTTTEVVGSTSLLSKMAEVCSMICSRVNQFSSSRNIAHQIKDIRMKLDDISKEKDRFGILRISGEKYHPEASRPRWLDTSCVLADESCVIGREVEKEKIMQWLLGSGDTTTKPTSSSIENNIHVLTLVGMGGVGKTTLARLVFNDPVVKSHFQPILWVCVSEDFDPLRITRNMVDDILSSLGNMKDSNLNQVQKKLKEQLEGKRFLLVLDDVWLKYIYILNWECFCEPLKCGNKGSKIIITTRDQKVTEMVEGTPIFLKGLSEENMRLIFKKYAFGGRDSDEQMKSLGRQMVQKLKGSPLAAKVIGRLLNAKFDAKYWKKLISSLPRYAADDITPILRLSYDHLSGHLKQCFAYCSLFPKDHRFSKEELLPLWMAHGFVQRRDHFLTEDVGSEQFDDLLCKSFFEHVESGFGESEFFVMHDLLHDLSELVSKDDCFRLDQDNTHKEFSEKTRHVSVATTNFDLLKLKELCKYGKLRTLLFLPGPYGRSDIAPRLNVNELFMMSKRLRALTLRDCHITELPESVGSLKHLRLLDISRNRLIIELPESLCNLYNLQVLNLTHCACLMTLPSNMSALINLRHLYVYDDRRELVSSIGAGLGKLTALQEVSVRGSTMTEVLTKMRMLRQLEINGLEELQSTEEAIQVRLCDMKHLDVLTLKWTDERVVNPRISHEEVVDALKPVETITRLTIYDYGGVRSPSWLDDQSWLSFSRLERVELKYCKNWEVLPPLGQLHHLKYLEIEGMGNKAIMRIEGGFIPPQSHPSEWELVPRPRWMPSSSSSSPALLSDLWITGCPNLKSLSDGLLQRVGHLTISDCPKLLPLVEDATTPSPSSSSPPAVMATHLTRLTIYGSSPIKMWLQVQCPSLQHLEICWCPELRGFDGDVGRELELDLAPSLRTLRFHDCKNLVSLPPRLRHLSRLEILHISDCPQIQRLPVAGLPESLRYLDIYGCGAALNERCQKEGGADWPLISHIPHLNIKLRDLGLREPRGAASHEEGDSGARGGARSRGSDRGRDRDRDPSGDLEAPEEIPSDACGTEGGT